MPVKPSHLLDPLALLRRPDKWYLGNGGMLLYAPPFPTELDTPGFWDACHYGDLAVPRLLAFGFAVEQQGLLTEVKPYLHHWDWYPDRIEARYYLVLHEGLGYKQQRGVRIFVNEVRRLGPDSTLHCELSFDTLAGLPETTLHVVAWTARQRSAAPPNTGKATDAAQRIDSHSDFAAGPDWIEYSQRVAGRAHSRGAAAYPLRVRMSATPKPVSLQITPSHGANLTPRLSHTPLWDGLKHARRGGLRLEWAARDAEEQSAAAQTENVLGSVTYAGMHWRVGFPLRNPVRISTTVLVGAAEKRPVATARISAGPGAALPPSVSGRTLSAPAQKAGQDPPLHPTSAWREFLSLVPHFECSDAMLTRYYWYRWYGLRLNAVPPGGNYVAPGVTEGLSYFRAVITYSLMCHIAECKWLADPALARGCLENHIAQQTKAGHFPAHIYLDHVNAEGFYHTDVGAAVAELLLHHPDPHWAAAIEAPLSRLLDFYLKQRDGEGLGLYDIRDQYETGQEFTSRYFHGDSQADMYGWEHALRLKGVDVTVYVYRLAQLLQDLALQRGDRRRAGRLAKLCAQIAAAVNSQLWNPGESFFFDFHAASGRRSQYKAAVGFYPLLTDIPPEDVALQVGRHLLPGGSFDAAWPTPTVPADDPFFSADPRWRAERANCPWNGRVWPMVNGHIVEVMAKLAALEPQTWRPRLAAYLRRWIELMHFEKRQEATDPAFERSAAAKAPLHHKDLTRPNCLEHYSPADGTACEYRGVDDYMHSSVVDPMLKYICGVRISYAAECSTGGASGSAGSQSLPGYSARPRLLIDPYPFGLKHLLLLNCHVHGQRLDLCLNRDRKGAETPGWRIYLNGRLVHRSAQIEKWECEL
ncbi:hypothetical protein IT575_06375 [bacterium]|nr:hypothetical protein [bacterium]